MMLLCFLLFSSSLVCMDWVNQAHLPGFANILRELSDVKDLIELGPRAKDRTEYSRSDYDCAGNETALSKITTIMNNYVLPFSRHKKLPDDVRLVLLRLKGIRTSIDYFSNGLITDCEHKFFEASREEVIKKLDACSGKLRVMQQKY